MPSLNMLVTACSNWPWPGDCSFEVETAPNHQLEWTWVGLGHHRVRPNACVLQRAVTRNTGPIFKPVVTSCRASNVSNLTLEWQFYICCRFCMCCSGIRTIGCRLGVDGDFLMKKVKECQNADFWLFSDGLMLSSRQLSVELLGQLETCSLKHIETILNTKETLTDICIYNYIYNMYI